MKKKIAELTEEEILTALESGDLQISDSDEKESVDDVILNFISFYNLKSGEELVHASLIRKLYKAWSYKDKPKFNAIELNAKLCMFLHKDRNYYHLDVSAIDLSLKAKEAFFKNKVSGHFSRRNTKKLIDLFLEQKSIKSGHYFITHWILYQVFVKWCKKIKRNKINFDDFRQFLKFFIKSDDDGFYIDKHTMNIAGDEIEEIKKEIQKKHKETEKAKKKIQQLKIQNQGPG